MLLFKKIENLRNDNNYTQKDFAAIAGKSREWYTKMLDRKDIMSSDLLKIANAFKVDITYFFKEDNLPGDDHIENEKVSIAKGSEDYREGWNTLIDTNKKSLEALLEMKVELDQCRDKLAECESEVTRLTLIQSSKRK